MSLFEGYDKDLQEFRGWWDNLYPSTKVGKHPFPIGKYTYKWWIFHFYIGGTEIHKWHVTLVDQHPCFPIYLFQQRMAIIWSICLCPRSWKRAHGQKVSHFAHRSFFCLFCWQQLSHKKTPGSDTTHNSHHPHQPAGPCRFGRFGSPHSHADRKLWPIPWSLKDCHLNRWFWWCLSPKKKNRPSWLLQKCEFMLHFVSRIWLWRN